MKNTESANKISSVVIISLALVSNPSAAWVLLNTMQFIYFLPISHYPFTPTAIKFCKAIGKFDTKTNVPKVIMNKKSLSVPMIQARKIGIQSSSLWINLGSDVTLLAGVCILFPIVYLLSRTNLGKFSQKVKEIKKNYRYSLFIRFFLQKSLAIGMFSFLCFNSVSCM